MISSSERKLGTTSRPVGNALAQAVTQSACRLVATSTSMWLAESHAGKPSLTRSAFAQVTASDSYFAGRAIGPPPSEETSSAGSVVSLSFMSFFLPEEEEEGRGCLLSVLLPEEEEETEE